MGQGNTKKGFGRAKGYGPGSGRGFKGAGIGGNVGGGFGKGNSPSGNNKSGQGGNNPFSKKGDKGFGDKGQISFSGLRNFFSNFFGSPADALGTVTGLANQATKAPPSQAKINRFLAKNIDITDLNPSVRFTIDGERLAKGFADKIPNAKIRKWVKNWTPDAIKRLKINHQLYSPTKIKPTDPRYTPTGTGSPKIDPKAEKYLEWMARQNPRGTTVSEMKKIYANNLKDGRHTLEQVMKMNPANSIPFYALIDDTKKAEEKALDQQYKNDQAIYNNNNKDMTTIAPGPLTDENWINQQYLSKFGRNADVTTKGGASYWLDKMKNDPTGHSRDEVARMLGASAEAKSFAKDGVVRPGGVKRDQSVFSQGVAGQEYAKHFQPGGALAGLNSADTLNKIAANTYKATPEAKPGESVATVMPGVEGGYYQFADEDVVAQPTLPGASPVPGTEGWWSQFADAEAFKKFLNEGKEESPAKSDGMGDFMKFMLLMNVMRPGGGGWGGGGGSQFGYGGLNPGGVQAAYDPMESLKGMGTWFKDNFGSGSGTTTNTVNTN